MIYLNKNIITKNEANDLLELPFHTLLKLKDNPNKIIDRILKNIEPNSSNKFKYDSDKSYYRIEHKTEGHIWHYDTGSVQQMLWCGYSASILLTEPCLVQTGGEVHFLNKIITPEQHYLNCVNYRSNEKEKLNKHSVKPHKGKRIVLLIFLECI